MTNHNKIIHDFGNIRLVIIDLDELKNHYYSSESTLTDDLQIYRNVANKEKKLQYKCLWCNKLYANKRERDKCNHAV